MIEFYILQFLPGNLILVTTVSNNGSVSLFLHDFKFVKYSE